MSRDASARPFLLHAPRSTSPFVLTCEHAYGRLPFKNGIGPDERKVLRSHWGRDFGAWELTRDLARRLKSSAIGGRWSRLLIDLNRRVDDVELIREVAGGVTLSWNAGLRPEEAERRIQSYHAPYHEEVDRLIMRRLVRGVRPLLLAIHTFTPVYDGAIRRFDIGLLYDKHQGLAHRLGRTLREAGFSVRYNQPYSGLAGMMYAVDRHGSHHRLPCLELEVNDSLFEKASFARRLGAVVARGIRELLR